MFCSTRAIEDIGSGRMRTAEGKDFAVQWAAHILGTFRDYQYKRYWPAGDDCAFIYNHMERCFVI